VSNPQINEQLFIEQVEKIGLNIREKGLTPILIVTNDIWLIPLAKNKKRLEEIYLYTFSDWSTIEKFSEKKTLYQLCDVIGIPYPKTYAYNNKNNKDISCLTPPLLVKPSNVPEFLKYFSGEKRNRVFLKNSETLEYLESLYLRGYTDEMIIQEYIPGGVENLYTATTYSTKKGKMKEVSVGCKLSQFPAEAGTITAGIIDFKEDVVNLTKKLLESERFFGIANTEFKYDERNGQFKLIEVNARPGMWNYSTLLSGINLFDALLDDLIYNKDIPYREGRNVLVWSRISKYELLNSVKNTKFKVVVDQLVKNGKVYDPLINNDEKVLFKLIVLFHNLKNRVSFLIRKFKIIFHFNHS